MDDEYLTIAIKAVLALAKEIGYCSVSFTNSSVKFRFNGYQEEEEEEVTKNKILKGIHNKLIMKKVMLANYNIQVLNYHSSTKTSSDLRNNRVFKEHCDIEDKPEVLITIFGLDNYTIATLKGLVGYSEWQEIG